MGKKLGARGKVVVRSQDRGAVVVRSQGQGCQGYICGGRPKGQGYSCGEATGTRVPVVQLW